MRQHEEFRNMMERAREEGRRERAEKEEKEKAESGESDSENRSAGESLETYVSPSLSN